jgi:hypothetical protein
VLDELVLVEAAVLGEVVAELDVLDVFELLEPSVEVDGDGEEPFDSEEPVPLVELLVELEPLRLSVL